MDQNAIIVVVLGILIPILTAILKAYNWQPVAAVWIKFAFAIISAVATLFLLGQFAGFKFPSANDPVAFLAFFGDLVGKIFALAVVIYALINKQLENIVRVNVRKLAPLVLLLLFVTASFVFPLTAFADSPKADLRPWMGGAATMGCGGSTPSEVQNAFTNFQNNRAKTTANYDWQGDYSQVVTDFLHKHGCISYGIDGLTMTQPLYVATWESFIDYMDILPEDILPVQFRSVAK